LILDPDSDRKEAGHSPLVEDGLGDEGNDEEELGQPRKLRKSASAPTLGERKVTNLLAEKEAEDVLELLDKGRVDVELDREAVCALNPSRRWKEEGDKGSDGLNRDERKIDLEKKI